MHTVITRKPQKNESKSATLLLRSTCIGFTLLWFKINVKRVVVPCVDICRREGIAPPFLSSVPDGGERSDARLSRFTPGYIVPVVQCIRGWVSSRAGLETMKKRKILLCRESNPTSPARSRLL
jgi:hypothetical protein